MLHLGILEALSDPSRSRDLQGPGNHGLWETGACELLVPFLKPQWRGPLWVGVKYSWDLTLCGSSC